MRYPLVIFAAIVGVACVHRPHAPNALPSPVSRISGGAVPFTFTVVEVPGAQRTVAEGIDDGGQIAGYYADSAGTMHGFLLRSGKFETIDFPGAVFTEAFGIGAGGEVVGTYRLPGEPEVNFHGFLRGPDGRFSRIDYPGYTNTIAQRILPDGTILGCRHNNDFGISMKGVVLRGPRDHATDAFASMHNGATPDLRRIVGLYNYAPGDRSSAYVIDDGEFKPLVVPASVSTSAWDVNAAGEVVGIFRDSVGVHGFILRSDGFTPLNAPNATMTRAFGVNTSGAVVGMFVADARTRGFLATPSVAIAR